MSGAGARALVERPIIFSGPMVRAILDGKKTQTRRLVKGAPCGPEAYLLGVHEGVWGIHADVNRDDGVWRGRCPYGRPGDRLWVRETAWYDRRIPFGLDTARCFFEGGAVVFESGARGQAPGHPDTHTAETFDWNNTLVKRPAIHMPRWASRTALEVVEVWIERLQHISRADAKQEGFWPSTGNGLEQWGGHSYGNAELAFKACWEDINGKRAPWDSNPWVWKVAFRKVEEGDVSRGGAEALSDAGASV